MANLKEIRSRISSVSSTRQVTSAMKMVSAAKLRRAQEAIINIRPYAEKLYEILGNLSQSIDSQEDNAYAIDRGEEKILLVAINSNRGLCGGFNANVTKVVQNLLTGRFASHVEQGKLDIITIGKNVYDFLRRRDFEVEEYNDLFNELDFDHVAPLAEKIMADFVAKKYDRVFLIYNQFKNAATQTLMMEQFLPVLEKEETNKKKQAIDYIYEPTKDEIISELIPKSLKIQFYRALLDSHAAEHGARMTAMHQATDNASDLIRELNLSYNKARQTAITNEILEIVSGAEALKG